LDHASRRPIRQTGLLLKAAFHRDAAAAAAAWREWEGAFTLDDAYWTDMKIATAAYPRVAAAGIETPLAPRLSGLRRFIWSTVQTRIAKAVPFLKAVAAAGVPAMLTKGAARLAAEPQAAPQRYIQDVDILVPPDRWAAAVDTLLAAGATQATPRDLDTVKRHMPRLHHALALTLEPEHELDLHQFALYLNRQEGADRRLWEHGIATRFRGVPVLVPHPAHRLALAFGHGLLYAPETAYDWVGDALAHIAQPGFDWALFAEEVEARELIAPASLGLEYLAAEIGAEIPATIRARLDAQLREPFVTELASRARGYQARGPAEQEAVREAALIRCEKALGLARRARTWRETARTAAIDLQHAWTEGRCWVEAPRGLGASDRLRLTVRFARSIAPPILTVSCLGESYLRIARQRIPAGGPWGELTAELPAALLLGHGLDGVELAVDAMEAPELLRQGQSFAVWTILGESRPEPAAARAARPARVAVVTPYAGDTPAQLQACCDSVRAQGLDAVHYVIAEGADAPVADAAGIVQVRLPAIGDGGITARGFGLQLAFNDGADAAACLDADSVFLPGHLRRSLAAMEAKGAVAVLAPRARVEGQPAEAPEASGLMLSRHAAFLAGAWMQYPRALGAGDMAQMLRLLEAGKLETVRLTTPGIGMRSGAPARIAAPRPFDAALYASRTGIGRRQGGGPPPDPRRRWRIAVVTAYADAPLETLRRGHDSVLAQAGEVAHILVCSGSPHAAIDGWAATHLRLPPRKDGGATARGLGAALAFKLGYDAVAFLDPWSWYAAEHVATLRHVLARQPVDLVCSWRRIAFADGAVLPQLDPEETTQQHADLSGMLITERMAFLGLLPAQIPVSAHAITDRLVLTLARGHAAAIHWTCLPTVFHETRDPRHLALAGRPASRAPADLRAIEAGMDPAEFSARTGRRPVSIRWPAPE